MGWPWMRAGYWKDQVMFRDMGFPALPPSLLGREKGWEAVNDPSCFGQEGPLKCPKSKVWGARGVMATRSCPGRYGSTTPAPTLAMCTFPDGLLWEAGVRGAGRPRAPSLSWCRADTRDSGDPTMKPAKPPSKETQTSPEFRGAIEAPDGSLAARSLSAGPWELPGTHTTVGYVPT